MVKILVIGESCTDRFIYGEISRLSPEAPVPVMTPIEVVENDGMSGNVVRNLKSINSDIVITHACQSQKIIKTRFVEKKSNHMFIRIDEGEKEIDKFERSININEFDIVVVSDYNKGFLSYEDLIYIGKNSKLSILDSKRKINSEIVKCFSFIKLNEQESKNNLDIVENSNNILVTLGSRGTRFCGEIFKSPNPQETIDVSGAGDTFTSCFIMKFFLTKDVSTSIIYANEMSSIVVSKRGVSIPN